MVAKVVVPPQFEDSKSEQYRYVFATGVFGGVNPNDGQMIFYLDRFKPETVNTPRLGAQKLKNIRREMQVEVHMTPAQFKAVAEWMKNHVEQYENNFGLMTPTPPKKKAPQPMYA
jgi:hypothetical protein